MTLIESLQLIGMQNRYVRFVNRLCAPGRYYHSLSHILFMFDNYNGNDANVAAMIWYHDMIYDPRAKDNELRSAELAVAELTPVGEQFGLNLSLIHNGIMATAGGHNSDDADIAIQTLCDLDLLIFGTDPARYDLYAQAIRMEYDFVPDDQYREGRAKLLRKFDEMKIYQTPEFQPYETQAHINLKREIENLCSNN